MITYTVKEINIPRYIDGKIVEKREAVIIKYFSNHRDVWFPSPLTEFIYDKYGNASINTKINYARYICQFINYLIKQANLNEDTCFKGLKEGGLHAINHFHLAKFINYISNNPIMANSYDTVKTKENILFAFYDFLYARKITGKQAKITRVVVPKNRGSIRGKYIYVSPFEEHNITIHYPNKDNPPKKILKDMAVDVWNSLLEYAEENYPIIALGVAFQCMGGLRMGEIVNLKIDSVKHFKNSKHMRLEILDRQKELFSGRNINEKKSQVKHQRLNQPVFDFNGRLFDIWDNHIRTLRNNPKVSNRMALFIDSDGQPMSGDSYEQYFYQLKNEYIEMVESNGNASLANELRQFAWGSHIGRHIFTNYLIKTGSVDDSKGKPSAEYLMILRGDKSPLSAGAYIDEKAVIETVIDKIDLISRVASSLN